MRHFIICLLVLCVSSSFGQTFEDLTNKKGDNLYNDTRHQLFLRYTSFSDPYTETIKGTTFNYSLRAGGSRKGEMNWHFENPTLGDFIFVLMNFKKANNSKTDKSFGSGFFGWHQVYFNAVVKDRFIFAPGFSMGDYIFGIQRPELGDPSVLEPNGYYFHLGPAIKASYVISKSMWVEGYVHNDIAFKASSPGGAYQKIKSYEKPYFFNVGGTLYTTTKFFGGFRINKLIDRGDHHFKATRLDINIGYML